MSHLLGVSHIEEEIHIDDVTSVMIGRCLKKYLRDDLARGFKLVVGWLGGGLPDDKW